MSEPIPDMRWYVRKSKNLGLWSRCPFATTHDCPRYYQSLSLLGDAGCTKIEEKEDKKLLAKWNRHALWPKTLEQSTGISSTDNRPSSYHHFCPEVAYDTFHYFATFLAKYTDEIDSELAQKRLSIEDAKSTDPRWFWQFITPQHYSECPLFAPLARADARSQQATPVPAHKRRFTRKTASAPDPITIPSAQHTSVRGSTLSSEHPEDRQIVFISYSHSDSKWLTRFERHLKPLLRGRRINAWSDKRIRTSDRWQEEINLALAASSAAVLLVSPDFLASDFIADQELPVILKGASDNGLRIFSIILSPCAFKEAEFKFMDSKNGPQTTTLSVFQAANPPSKTLAEMKKSEWERTLLQTANEIANLNSPSKGPYEPPQKQNPTRAVNRSGAFGPGDMPPPPQYPADDPRNPDFFGR